MKMNTMVVLHRYLKEVLGYPPFRVVWGKWPWTESLAASLQISALDSFGCVSLGKQHPLSEPKILGYNGL